MPWLHLTNLTHKYTITDSFGKLARREIKNSETPTNSSKIFDF